MIPSMHTDFPGGNGLLLDAQESPQFVTARFAAEPKNCPEAMWFHFRLEGLAGRRLRAVLANPEQTLGGGDWSKNRPVFRREGEQWRRSEAAQRADTDGGRTEWAWEFGPCGDWIEVAHCFPYQPADLGRTLSELAGAFGSTMIGVSLAGRPLPRVFNSLADAVRPAVYLTARHHAGETPGSWVLDGLLRHVAAEAPLRGEITWWAAPFVDLDDVIAGSYGKDPFPHDCNRSYGPGGARRVEVAAVMADVRRLQRSSARLFFVDLHAPAHHEQQNYVPLHGWSTDDAVINPMAEEFANLFQAACPEDIRSPVAHITPKTGGNSRHVGLSSSKWALDVLKADSITLETSYQGNGRTYYTVEDYHRLGAALAETLAQWFAGKANAGKPHG